MLLVRVIHTYWYDVLTVLYVFFVGGLITRVWAKRYKKNRKKSCIIFFFVAWLHNNTNNTNNTDLVYYLLSSLWFVVVPLLVHYNTYCNIIQESNPSSCTTLHTYLFAQTHKHTNTQTHKHTNTQTHKHTNTQTHRAMSGPIFPLVLVFIGISFLIKVVSERIAFFSKSNIKYRVLDFLGKLVSS